MRLFVSKIQHLNKKKSTLKLQVVSKKIQITTRWKVSFVSLF